MQTICSICPCNFIYIVLNLTEKKIEFCICNFPANKELFIICINNFAKLFDTKIESLSNYRCSLCNERNKKWVFKKDG